MESEFVALAATSKEVEWLRNLTTEIPIWPKPIAPISIRCDSATTLAKAYSQIYNGNSKHLGVRHSMIRELIRNGMISIEFVWSQHNLADHLMKGLARDLVIKCKTKRITYVNMKFCRFKKLGIGFLYGSRGMRPLAGSRGRAPCWGPATRLAGVGRGAAPHWGLRAMVYLVLQAMVEEDAFLVDNVDGGLCVDYTNAKIAGRCNCGSDKDKGKVGER
ncbi:hypothetical protein Tco_0713964 [Tanacetum coccineum]